MHGGGAPQVRQAALERILAASDPVAAEMIRLAKKARSETVRRQACTDILDRAGLERAVGVAITGKVSLEAIDGLIHGSTDD